MSDSIEFEILEDGRCKAITDKISLPQHQNAENVLAFIGRLTGTPITRKARTDVKHGDSKHHHHQKS